MSQAIVNKRRGTKKAKFKKHLNYIPCNYIHNDIIDPNNFVERLADIKPFVTYSPWLPLPTHIIIKKYKKDLGIIMFPDTETDVTEECVNGYNIYIEPNADRYQEGFTWSVSKGDIERSTGLAFTMQDALLEARAYIENA